MARTNFRLPLQPPTMAAPATRTVDESYDNLNENIILETTEDQRVERKSARIDPRQLGDYFSVYANRPPHGGLIFVGVTDAGEIEGCNCLDSKRIDELEQTGRNFCQDARYDSKRVPAYNIQGEKDWFLAFRVAYRPDKVVENSKGEAYARIGSSKKKLSDLEKRELRISKGEIDFEREPVVLDWPESFDQNLVQQFCQTFAERRDLSIGHTFEDILALACMCQQRKSRFFPNNACALMFAKNPRLIFPGSRVRILKFDGTRELTGAARNELADLWVDGPLPLLIEKAERALAAALQGRTRLDQAGKFTSDLYPRDAWREALVNACVHRSYNLRNMNVFVRIYDDRVTFESPGGFPPPTTSSTVYDAHNPRNPHLMDALFYFDFVKCAREGARRMRDLMEEAKLPPPEFSEVDLDGYQVRVVLRAPDADKEKKIVALGLTEEELAVFEAIGNFGVSVSDVEKAFSVSWRKAKALLSALEAKKKCMRRSPSGRPGDPKARYFRI